MLAAIEPLENVRQIILGDPRSAVGHGQVHRVAALVDIHGHRGAQGGPVDRVLHQVADRGLQRALIAFDRGASALDQLHLDRA